MPNHSPPPMAVLIVRQGPYAGKRAVISQTRYAIGTDARCQLHPPNSGLAPLHAIIHLHEGAYYLQDRSNAEGTWVNGRPVQTARLQPGDRLRIGDLELEFQLRTQPVTPSSPRPADKLKAVAPIQDTTPQYPASGLGYSLISPKGAAPSPYASEAVAEPPTLPPARQTSNPWIGRLYVAALLLVGFLLLVVVLPELAGTRNTSAAPPPGFSSSSGATVLYFYADW